MCTAIGAASTTSKTFIARSISRTRRCHSALLRTPRRPMPAMSRAHDFVESARGRGFDWYAGVPCSFLSPFINYVLQDPSLHYFSMANEGDAVALIAGVALAGAGGSSHGRGISMMQNSGLGNSGRRFTF